MKNNKSEPILYLYKAIIIYDLDRFYSETYSNYIEGRKFVPRMWLGGQTGDKNVEKIGITKENTFPKTIILPYLSRF